MAVDDETIVLTRKVDRRHDVKYPIWEMIVTGTWDADDTDDVTLRTGLEINGTIREILFSVLPSTITSGATGQVQIKDNDLNIIHDSGEKAASATINHDEVIHAVTGTLSVVLGISKAAGASGAVLKVTIRGT